jgi:DNA recombination protein RmuC
VLIALAAVVGLVVGALVVRMLWLADRQALVAGGAKLEAERDAAVREVDAERARAAEMQARARDTFAALSHDALRDNRQDFLHTADAVLKPVRETLEKVQSQLAAVDKEREGSFREVAARLGTVAQGQEELRQATETLARSLRSPNVRGRWGEIQLKNIVRLAGMLEQCDFVEKATATSDSGGRQTPDMIVRLPGGASIVIDSKVPIDAYLDSAAAKDDAARTELLGRHARQLRDHVRSLASKEYWRQFQPAPEFVVMFLPLEPLLSAAFEQDGQLLEQAAALRVIPASPMTLLALLKAVACGWQQQQLARSAEEIQLLGRELYERLATMTGHLENVGANIKQAADSYDRLLGSLELKVLPGARKFKELGVNATKELPDLDPLRLEVRQLVKPELTAHRNLLDTGNDTEH